MPVLRGLALTAVFLVHLVSSVLFVYIFYFHFSPRGRTLPGWKGFGKFFRYYTFNSWTMQMIQLLGLLTYDVRRMWGLWTSVRARRRGLKPAASVKKEEIDEIRHWNRHLMDDVSSTMVASATAVTIMFYALNAVTKGGMIEGGRHGRPDWLSATVHQGNVVVAWVELIAASLLARLDGGNPNDPSPYRRSFSRRSRIFMLYISGIYMGWVLIVKRFNGAFPYPFLNNGNWVPKFAACTVAMTVLTQGTLTLGLVMQKILALGQGEGEPAVPSARKRAGTVRKSKHA